MEIRQNDLKKLIIIIPAYNEANSIDTTIRTLFNVQKDLVSLGFESFFYVIDDGSIDETASIALNAGAHKLIKHKLNQGLGSAVRTGLKAAHKDNADIVIKFDADLQHNTADIKSLVLPIINGEADIVYGNRFEKISYRMPLLRKIGNVFFTKLLKILTGWPLKDSQPGIFAVNKDYLDVFNLPGDYNYTQQILLDGYHKGMRFAHVPVSFNKRASGQSFVSYKYPFIVFFQILLVLISIKPMLVFGISGLLIFLAGFSVAVIELSQYFFNISYKPVLHVNLVLGLLLCGLQIIFFGLLAELFVRNNRK